MKLFGRAKKAPPPSESLQKMKASADLLDKRIQFLEQKQVEQQEQAKKFLSAGNKRAAMTCLKRKKMYEKQVVTLQAAVDRIEEQCMAIEGASANLEAMNAMKTGATAMKTINQGMSIIGLDNNWQYIVKGLVLLVAVIFDVVSNHKTGKA